MRGTLLPSAWHYDPAQYAPPRYRRGCRYDAFVPQPLAEPAPIAAVVAGTLSAAENAIRELNAVAQSALRPLARLLLRTESIGSSKVEGMQVDARTLARAEARADAGHSVGPEAAEILANVDAMQLAVEEAASLTEPLRLAHILDIHRVLLERTPNRQRSPASSARRRTGSAATTTTRAAPTSFLRPRPSSSACSATSWTFCNDDTLPPLAQAALAHAQFETIHPFVDGNGRTGRALVQVILRRRGLAPAYVPPISVVLAADRAGYIGGLVAFREGPRRPVARALRRRGRARGRAGGVVPGARPSAPSGLAGADERHRLAVRRRGVAPHRRAARPSDHLDGGGHRPHRPGEAPRSARVRPARRGTVLLPLGQNRGNRLWEAAGLLDLLADLDAGRG